MECINAEYFRALTTLGDSESPLIDAIFRFCVLILQKSSVFLGMSYEAINIWIFVVIWPALTFLMFVFIIVQRQSIKRLKHNISTD
jgi:hypothetical protein